MEGGCSFWNSSHRFRIISSAFFFVQTFVYIYMYIRVRSEFFYFSPNFCADQTQPVYSDVRVASFRDIWKDPYTTHTAFSCRVPLGFRIHFADRLLIRTECSANNRPRDDSVKCQNGCVCEKIKFENLSRHHCLLSQLFTRHIQIVFV